MKVPSLRHRPNRRQELRVNRAFHHIADGARLLRGANVANLVVNRENDDPRFRTDLLQGDNGGEPSAVGHGEVHQHHVRLGVLDADHGVGPIGRFANHFHIRLRC